MSLIPRNSSGNPTQFTPFSQDFWDQFFSHHNFPLRPFSFFPFLSPPHTARTVPYSQLSLETSGDVRTRLECKEIPEAHLIVADLPGFQKHEVDVAAEDGGFLLISAVDGRFSWRLRLPEEAQLQLMNSSMENGVLTVVIPKYAVDWDWERDEDAERARNVRIVEITGSD